MQQNDRQLVWHRFSLDAELVLFRGKWPVPADNAYGSDIRSADSPGWEHSLRRLSTHASYQPPALSNRCFSLSKMTFRVF